MTTFKGGNLNLKCEIPEGRKISKSESFKMKISREIFFVEKQIWCQDKTVEEELREVCFRPARICGVRIDCHSFE